MIKTTKDHIRATYIKNFNRFWWTIAAMFLVASIVVLTHNTVQVSHLVEDTQQTVKTIKKERKQRVEDQNRINDYVCGADDQQDALFAKVLASVYPDDAADVLTRRQENAKRVFEEAVYEIEHKADCVDVVERIEQP